MSATRIRKIDRLHLRRPPSRYIGIPLTTLLLTWPVASYGQQAGPPRAPDIVVVGQRYGEADLLSETELDEEAIADYSADSIGELLQTISPLIDGSDEQPVLIVNGKRITDPRDISGYPPEALQRVEILPREAASQYGYAPEKRVVNLVLKRQFSGLTLDGNITVPTAGGRSGQALNAQRVAITGQARWNIGGAFSRETMLLESARDVPPLPGLGSIDGNFRAIDGSELDPAFSELAGATVTNAAIPPFATGRPLTLTDLLAGADRVNARDDARFRSLAPETGSASLDAGFVRPLGRNAALSLNVRAGRQTSRQWLGLAHASLILPATSPFSPFSGDVSLERLLLASGPLVAARDVTSFGVSGAVNGTIGRAHAMLSLTYDRSDAEGRTERGFDLGNVVTRLAAGDPALNPFGPLPVGAVRVDRARSTSESASLRLMLGDALIALPAGAVRWNLAGSYNRFVSRAASDDAFGAREDRRISEQGDTRLSLNLPIASRRAGVLSGLGEFGLQLAGGVSLADGMPVRTRFNAGFSWSPIPTIALNAQASVEDDAPSDEQRNAPIVETPNVRIYDYARGELAEVTRISGGNPALGQGGSRSLMLGAMIRPLGGRALMLNLDYRRREVRNGIGSLPALTPVVEAAFSDRVRRDASGRLISVDLRPIALARSVGQALRTRLSWTHMLPGPPATPGAPPEDAEPDEMMGPPPSRAGGPPGAGMGPAPGMGPGFGLGRGRGWGGRGNGRIQLSLNHGWQLRNTLLIRQGLPLLDRLRGDGGGQSRHTLQLQALAARGGAGISFDLRWQSAYRTRAGAAGPGAGDLRFAPATRAGLKLDLDLGRLKLLGRPPWLARTRFSIDIDNLFDTRQRVTRADGSVPPGYTRDEVDPIGRAVRVSVRRRF